MPQPIVCPQCSFQIEVTDALCSQLREQLRKEFEGESRRKEGELLQREDDLHRRELKLESSRQSLEEEVLNRVTQERTRLLEEAKAKAQESVSLEIRDLQDQLQQANLKLGEALSTELELRQERRELEDEKRQLELTVIRRLDEERNSIRDDAKREAIEEYRLKEADKDKHINDLRRQIDDLKRKSEQGSQQAQGEVMELELEDLLSCHFPFDTIEAVPVGRHGGDVLQHVHDASGEMCGTILWESKRTKAWNDAWLPKLRDDQRVAKAHLAALLTAEMPKSLTSFGCVDGTWVTNRSCVVGLAAALRAGLIEAARTRRAVEGKQTKLELVYQYLSGPEFRQRVEGIAEAFITMKQDLEAEKRSLNRLWAKREKQLQRAVVHTAGLYGDLSGIIGASLPQIPNLELEADPGVRELIASRELQEQECLF